MAHYSGTGNLADDEAPERYCNLSHLWIILHTFFTITGSAEDAGIMRIGAWMLQWVLPPEEAERLARELDEVRRARARRRGRTQAALLHARDLLELVARLRAERVGRGVRSLAGRDRSRSAGPGYRHALPGGNMGDVLRDVRLAARSLRRNPGFTAVVILTLALGIGAGTTVYAIADTVLVRALPYPEPERLVAVWQGMLGGEVAVTRERAGSFEGVAGYRPAEGVTVVAGGEGVRLRAARVEPQLFDLLGLRVRQGRSLTPADAAPGAAPVAVLSHALWQERFGGDPGVIGRTLAVEGELRTVVGVMAPEVEVRSAQADLWLPLVLDPGQPGALWGYGGIQVVGRLRPGATPETAAGEMRTLSAEMRLANPLWTPVEDYRAAATVVPLREAWVGGGRQGVLLLLGAVTLVLLTACANVANLLLARAVGREGELAIRKALGAGRWRIARQALAETLLLAGVGGAGGVALAWAGTAFAGSWLPPDTPRVGELGMDGRVLAISAGVTLLTALLFGLAPALQAALRDPQEALREVGRGGGLGGRQRLTRGLVVLQVALSVVLLTATGLLVRSLDELMAVDPGFRTEGLVVARVSPPLLAYADRARQRELFREVLAEVRSSPAVENAALTSQLYFDGQGSRMAVFLDGVTQDPNDLPVLAARRTSAGFLDVMEIPLLEGRSLTDADDPQAPLVGLMDEAAARRFWPGSSPVGARFRYPWRGAPWIEIVGVVGAVRDGSLADEPEPAFYVPFAQDPVPSMTVVASPRGGAATAIGVLREAVAATDPAVAVSHVSTMERLVRGSAVGSRSTTVLLGAFAALTLLLVGVGLYGVLSWAARRRAPEMGLRIVLGAEPASVLRLMIRDGLVLTGVGFLFGVAAAWVAAGALRGMLYAVGPVDAAVLVAVPAILGGVALLASWVPARRAASVSPASMLNSE